MTAAGVGAGAGAGAAQRAERTKWGEDDRVHPDLGLLDIYSYQLCGPAGRADLETTFSDIALYQCF